MSWLIYKHTSPSGRCYIGQTLQEPNKRWNNGNGYSRAFKFGRAIDKYGWENFKHEILEKDIPSQELANEREYYYINFYDSYVNGYNSTKGGDNFDHLGSAVYQIGLDGKIIKKYETAAQAERENNILAQNIGACLLGHQLTAGGFYWANATTDFSKWSIPKTKKDRAVICVDTKKVYNSITVASKVTNISISSIGKCAQRLAITAGGFHWCYADEYDEFWTPPESKKVGGLQHRLFVLKHKKYLNQ